MSSIKKFKAWYDEHSAEIRKDYFEFLRFQSISADPAYKKEVLACAEWLKRYLEKGGLKVELLPTPSYPIVYAEMASARSGAETVLLYGHYDVQPIHPI